MSETYPDSWALGLATREQRRVIAKAGGGCELNYHGCTSVAVTTAAIIPTDPISDQRAACQSCSDRRRR